MRRINETRQSDERIGGVQGERPVIRGIVKGMRTLSASGAL